MSYNIFEIMLGRFRDLMFRISNEIPFNDFLSAIFFVLLGLIFGKIIYVIVASILELIRFDRLAEKIGLYELLDSRMRMTPSQIAGRIAYWIVIALFIMAGIDSLQIVDVPHILESLVGLGGRIFTFLALIVLADLIGRIAGAIFDSLLQMTDHPAGGKISVAVHIFILLCAVITNLDVMGIDIKTGYGIGIVGVATAMGFTFFVMWARARLKLIETEKSLRRRVKVGYRLTLTDGRTGVVRKILADSLILAGDEDEWLIPAAWVLDAPIKVEDF